MIITINIITVIIKYSLYNELACVFDYFMSRQCAGVPGSMATLFASSPCKSSAPYLSINFSYPLVFISLILLQAIIYGTIIVTIITIGTTISTIRIISTAIGMDISMRYAPYT